MGRDHLLAVLYLYRPRKERVGTLALIRPGRSQDPIPALPPDVRLCSSSSALQGHTGGGSRNVKLSFPLPSFLYHIALPIVISNDSLGITEHPSLDQKT